MLLSTTSRRFYSNLNHNITNCKFDHPQQTYTWYESNDDDWRNALEAMTTDVVESSEELIPVDSDIDDDTADDDTTDTVVSETQTDHKIDYTLFRINNPNELYEEHMPTKILKLDRMFSSDPNPLDVLEHARDLQNTLLFYNPEPDESEEECIPHVPRGPYARVHVYLELNELITPDMQTEDFSTDHSLHDVRCGNERVKRNDLKPLAYDPRGDLLAQVGDNDNRGCCCKNGNYPGIPTFEGDCPRLVPPFLCCCERDRMGPLPAEPFISKQNPHIRELKRKGSGVLTHK